MTKLLHHYLVKPLGREYVIEKNDIIVTTGIENHKDVNRFGVVIHKPINDDSELMVGDICVVHHNSFRTYYDMKGREKKSSEYFRDNLYLIPREKIYLIKRDERWQTISGFIFVKPIVYNQDSQIYIPKQEEEHVGIVAIGSSSYFEEGDKIAFKKNREYAFDIDGEKLYRMNTKDVVALL